MLTWHGLHSTPSNIHGETVRIYLIYFALEILKYVIDDEYQYQVSKESSKDPQNKTKKSSTLKIILNVLKEFSCEKCRSSLIYISCVVNTRFD